MLCFLLVTDAFEAFIFEYSNLRASHITSPSTHLLHISTLQLLLWHITFIHQSSGVRMSWREWWLRHQKITLSSWWLFLFIVIIDYFNLFNLVPVSLSSFFILTIYFNIVQLGEAVAQLPVWAVVLLVTVLAVVTIIAGAVAYVYRGQLTDLTDRLRLNWLVYVCFFLYVGKQSFKFRA